MSQKKTIIGLIAAIVVVIAGIYIFKSIGYQNKFLPNTVVDGLAIENKTVSEANNELKSHYQNKEFSATENGKELFTFKGVDIGITDDFTKDLTKLKNDQNGWSWPIRMLKKTSTKSELKDVTYDQATFDQFVENLPLTNESRVKPENAKVEKTAAGFTIEKEVMGDTFDLDKVKKVLAESINSGNTKIKLETSYQKPTVMSDDAGLKERLAKLESLSKLTITYNISGQKETVPPATLLSWLSESPEGEVTVDQAGVKVYLQGLSDKHSTYEKTRTFKSTRRGEVQVPAGTYGWTLQVDKEAPALAADILTKTDLQDRKPIVAGSGYGVDVGNTYIEVDLVNQHMWYYREGALVLETDVVTGKPATPTPAGVFSVWNKERNATLKGEDYATPVDHWMPIDWNGVGIHDSPWQPAYGGTLYQTVGSHGCINTPPAVMVQLYEKADLGTPVLVF